MVVGMHLRAIAALVAIAAPPAAAQLLVSPPRAGEQETAQAGGGAGRFSFVGALRCPEGLSIVAARTATGPLLNGISLGCAPIACEAGRCGWRAGSIAWQPWVGRRGGAEATLACQSAAAVAGFRAEVVAVAQGTAVASLALDCAIIRGLDPAGSVAVAAPDQLLGRSLVPPARATHRVVAAACRDRAIAAFSVAIGAYPAGAGGEGEHVRALSAFCPGAVQ